jgi:hypothetical protein
VSLQRATAIAPIARGRHDHTRFANMRVFTGMPAPPQRALAGGFWNVLGPSQAHRNRLFLVQ